MTSHSARVYRAILLAGALGFGVVSCGQQAQSGQGVTPAPAQAVAAQSTPVAQVAAPSATPAAEPTKAQVTPTAQSTAGEPLKPVATQTSAASTGGEPLKPSTAPSPTVKATVAPVTSPVVDRLKPATTPAPRVATVAPAKPSPTPASADKPGTTVKPSSKIQMQAIPTPSRKGVANSSVDPEEYLLELVSDLQSLAVAVDDLGVIWDDYSNGDIGEDEMVAGFEESYGTVRELYLREVARDYPPQYKEIDDYYVESLRSADKMFETFVKLVQTLDERYVAELVDNYGKFEFFMTEFVKRVENL